jgi:hypothetical protein
MITEVFRTVPGDFNLDGFVDAADYVVWRKMLGTGGATYTQGDADLDSDVDGNDLAVWRSQFGFIRQPLMAGAGSGSASTPVPEPASLLLAALVFAMFRLTTNTPRTQSSNTEMPMP